MSATKHFFKSQDGLVAAALRGAAAQNPTLAVLEKDKILFHATHDRNHVSILSGGGSGHEPSHAGYVGEGMLQAAVCGDVFASPSTKQIETAVEHVPSDKGHIFIVTNYTGDMLHFGLAVEKINASGKGRAALIRAADDVSVGRAHGGLVGRRGLSGTIVLNKVTGACAATGASFDTVLKVGQAVQDSLVTINAGLDHCHVMGRGGEYGQLKPNQIEIGMGIHNEPGVQLLDEIPDTADLVHQMLDLALNQDDADRAFVPFGSKTDKLMVLINNLGGVAQIEQLALTDLVLADLTERRGLPAPSRVYSGHFMTSLNAPIFAVTVLNVTHAAKLAGVSEDSIFGYLDAPSDALAWPRNHYQSTAPVNIEAQLAHARTPEGHGPRHADVSLDPQDLDSKLRRVAFNLIAAEPALTEWDTKMGDGDCGKTLESGANALLQALNAGLAKSGSLLDVLEATLEITEDRMGGTLGAIFSIYFAALVAAIKAELAHDKTPDVTVLLSKTCAEALKNLRTHTPASEGDRTVMDVLIPFVASFQQSQSLETAMKAAGTAAEGTKHIKPKLGRATYVGGIDTMKVFPPDPGAWALYEIVRGLAGLQNAA